MGRKAVKWKAWQIELFEAWANAGFPDNFEYTMKRGTRRGMKESINTFREIAAHWREQFHEVVAVK